MKRVFFFFFCLLAELLTAQESGLLDRYIAGNKQYKEYPYDSICKSPFQFAFVDPALVVLPCLDGVIIPGNKSWLWREPEHIVTGIYPCMNDKHTYAIMYDSSGSNLYDIQKIDNQVKHSKIQTLGKGWFTMYGISNKEIYIWGKENKACLLWKFNGINLELMYTDSVMISDIAWLNDQQICAVTVKGEILILENNKSPHTIMKTNTVFDGIEVASDGSVFLSTPKGVFRYYSIEDLNDLDPVTYLIHGTLQLHHDWLYINWREKNELVSINIFSN
jgi:hypothetical protein